ncbi:GNAT family N-acetyltransferase [Amnibacterium endophyticum]|uniref:GNAT family N-acetyltransferase n=1 Tax=Amnibacterium endophyticum TaxID=2109337 RepID=A0ABW4LEM7_9MICO
MRTTVEQDWPRVRDLRLEMLADTPIAYLETLEAARRHPESHWRRQARGRASGVRLVAEAPGGALLGTMGGVVTEGVATLVGVYVTPRARGRRAGVTDALLDGVEEWAARQGDQLRLEVNERNPRAIAAYASRGFVMTGRTSPYPLTPPSLELEMVKALRVV